MNTVRSAVMLLSLGLAASCLGASQQEVNQLIESGDYGKAIIEADALLNSGQTAASDRYTILMLKGEAAMRAGQRQLAGPAFRAAARLAADRPQAIAAMANAIVVQRAPDGTLRIGQNTYDVTKPENRRVAMQKLSEDMIAAQIRQIQDALNARTLPPILGVLPDVYRAYVLETYATNGEATTAETLARKLGTQAHDLILDELRRLQRDTSTIEQSVYTVETWPGWIERNLTANQRRELRGELDYIARIRGAILEIRRLAESLRVNTAPWDRLTSDCVDLEDQINLALNRPPGPG